MELGPRPHHSDHLTHVLLLWYLQGPLNVWFQVRMGPLSCFTRSSGCLRRAKIVNGKAARYEFRPKACLFLSQLKRFTDRYSMYRRQIYRNLRVSLSCSTRVGALPWLIRWVSATRLSYIIEQMDFFGLGRVLQIAR